MINRIKKIALKNNPINKVRINREKKRLKNNSITILSSNCLGGLLYHELGIQFQSPTINTRFSSKEFVRFILNIEHYLESEFSEIESSESYPVGRLDDIIVHFVHYHSFEEAVTTWKNRCKRINWENIFVILNDCDGINEQDMLRLEECRLHNIVIFTSKPYSKSKYAFYLPTFEGERNVGNMMKKNFVTGAMYVEKYFDFVGWFNQEKTSCLEDYRK